MFTISLADRTQEQVSNFCGVLNRNVKAIEQHYNLRLRFKDEQLELVSPETATDTVPQTVVETVEHILEQCRSSALSLQEVEKMLNVADKHSLVDLERFTIKLRSMYITPQSELQCRYLERIAQKVEFLFQQITGRSLAELARGAIRRGMCPMCGAKSVVDINITERSQLLRKIRVVCFFFFVETQILQ